MLETRYVFVDTQVFVASGFDYDSGRLGRARDYAQAGRIRLISTPITHEEILSNVREALSIATGILQKLREKGRVLATSLDPDFGVVFRSYNEDAIFDHLSARLSTFEAETETSIIQISDASAEEVFRKYFSGSPPFSEKKKSEFPDAFVIQALIAWCSRNDERLYVVSGDADMAEACADHEALVYVSSLEEIFELIALDDQAADIARSAVEGILPEIEAEAVTAFEYLGFYLEDQDGDVNSVRVTAISGGDLHIVDIEDEIVHFTWEVEVAFTADVSYADMSTAIYDSEDKVAYPWNYIETELERSVELAVHGQIQFSRDGRGASSLRAVRLDSPQDIGITVEMWEDYK